VAAHLLLSFICVKEKLLIITFLEELRFAYKSLLLSASLQLLRELDWVSGNGETEGVGEK
jgi:hypothetical protein